MKKSIVLMVTACMLAALISCATAKPAGGGVTQLTTDWQGLPNPVGKRGVSYSFEQDKTPEEDMALLASNNGIKWFYNWYVQPEGKANQAAKKYNVAFYPMVWNNWEFEDQLAAWLAENPGVEYLLGFNEPNLTDQCNYTPSEAAKYWPRLVKFAKKHNLKVVAPAMNYGTLENYWVPWVWLDEFFGIDSIDEATGNVKVNKGFPGVSLDDIDAISVHCYMPDAGAMKWYISQFKRYGKPIWMTEFCSWEYSQPDAEWQNLEHQMQFMSEAIIYMELDPYVEKYAWFIPKGSDDEHNIPANKLLSKTVLPDMTPPKLLPLGEVFVNMSVCDKTVWVPAGERISASNITDTLFSEYINSEFDPDEMRLDWPRKEQGFTKGSGVHFRPGTDEGGAALDLFDFTRMKWVEYQVEVPETKTYTLSLRNTALEATQMEILVDGNTGANITLNPASAWTTGTVAVDMEAGKHTLRLKVIEGDCALNWLILE